MRTTRSTPQWAIDLVEEVCKDYHRALPSQLKWYNSTQSHWSSGWTRTYTGEIFIRTGRCGYDQELVLLHELAHHLVGKTKKGKKAHHNIKFWKLAFELYWKYGVDLGYAIYREEHYRAKATQAYNHIMAKAKV